MAIDAVSEASGDDWRALRDRLLKAEELVQALKDILPQHGDELDSMLVGLRSKVDKLGASRKKKKLVPPEPDTQELALSGDIMSHDDPQKQAQRKLDSILSAVNKRFNPHFRGEIIRFFAPDEEADYLYDLRDEHDIEVDENDVVPFSLNRDGDIHRSALKFLDGIILPDGQIYSIMELSDSVSRVGAGGSLHKNVKAFVKHLYHMWGEAEAYNGAGDGML